MGYKPETINLALEDCKNHTLEEVLDLLLFHENNYKPNPSNKPKKNSLVENIFDDLEIVASKKRKNSGKEKGKGNKNDRFDEKKVPKKESFKEANNDEREKVGISENLAPVLPKIMDTESALYMNTIRKTLNVIDSKDPNEYVTALSDHLKFLKFNTSDLGQAVHKYLFSGAQFGQIIELRKKIYEVIMKIMTMKRQGEVNIQEFEYVLLMSFENRVLNTKQMDHILTAYHKFCTKAGYSQDDVLVSSLERYYTETKKAQALPNNGASLVQDMDNYLMTDIALMKCPNITSIKHDALEESKLSDIEVIRPKVVVKQNEGKSEKELCIVCTGKTREIVFLPCCHFLSCSKCSPQVTKCPICYKKVEKNLKIFWS